MEGSRRFRPANVDGVPLPARVVVLANFLLRVAALLLEAGGAWFLTFSGTALTGVLCGVGLFLTTSGTALTGGTSMFVLVFWV